MPEFGVIEDIPVTKPAGLDKREKTGLVRALFKMRVGQSALFQTTYATAHNAISKARRRKLSAPLKGRFLVVPEGNGVRVGRVE